jgi:uncharacterized protein YutE (UPF0331/DUF86 family)
MKRLLKTLITMVLALSIVFCAVPVRSYAAVDQAKQVKKLVKHIKKIALDNEFWTMHVKSKKTKKGYDITVTSVSNNLSKATVQELAARNDQDYRKIIESLGQLSKAQYKRGKKEFKLKKTNVIYIWKTFDGYTVVTVKNGIVQ